MAGRLQRPKVQAGLEYNYAYYPVIFSSENELLLAFDRLGKIDVFPRRYFFPSLNTLPYLKKKESCPISENLSKRIACLPIYIGLLESEVEKICKAL